MKTIDKFTFGVGDRFAHQAEAQLRAFQLLADQGVQVTPVWNKSNREHLIVGSEPAGTRAAADAAVSKLGWSSDYLLDADHINLETVDRYLPHCDFYTIDVADDIGTPAAPEEISAFIDRHPELVGTVVIEGIEDPLEISREDVERTARQFLKACELIQNVVLLELVPLVTLNLTHARTMPS